MFLKDSVAFKVFGNSVKFMKKNPITEEILIVYTLLVWNKMKFVKYYWFMTD